MEVLLWAFGSTSLVMLIIFFLPLGLTKKGKVILVGTSFLLALGGIAATASFSFLITLLILVVLILFVTYLLDQRLGKFLYTIDNSTEEVDNEDFYMDADRKTAASHESVYQRKNEGAHELLSLLKDEKKEITRPETKQNEENDLPVFETTGDEDISFLLERTVPMEETSKELKHEEVDYLAEIEELLDDDLSDLQSFDLSKHTQNTAINAESKHEIPVLSFEDKPEKKSESSTKSARKIEDFDEIPILPFHEKEEEQS
jgi:hypothetical protein